MIRAVLFAMTLLCAAVVHAQPSATGVNATQMPPPTSGDAAPGQPRPLGPAATSPSNSEPAPHQKNCSNLVPAGAKPPSGEDPPLVRVTITTDGELQDPQILKGTGDDTEDRAIVACAEGNHLAPIKVNGEPTEVTWVLGFYVWPAWSGFIPASATGSGRACAAHYPLKALRAHAEGDVAIAFRIAADGSTKDINMQQSSGNADRTSSNCVASWRYFPATHNGQPVEVDWVVKIGWRLTRHR